MNDQRLNLVEAQFSRGFEPLSKASERMLCV